uniref:Secreted protein n=1 Tax=Eutreptiella gymnastica TaxID=73025 RepID=A0A7S4CZJ5_9EUGL
MCALVWVLTNQVFALLVPSQGGEAVVVGGSGTVVPLPAGAASAPSAWPPRRRWQCVAQNLSRDREVWRALTTTNDVGIVTRGPGGSGSPSVTHQRRAACPGSQSAGEGVARSLAWGVSGAGQWAFTRTTRTCSGREGLWA